MDSPGFPDFARVFAVHLDELVERMTAVAASDPTFARTAEAMSPKEVAARERLWRKALVRALEGDLETLDRFLEGRGTYYARLGVSLQSAQDTLRTMEDQLGPILVSALVEPARVNAALATMHRFFGRAASVLGRAFVEAKKAEITEIIARNTAILDRAPDAVVTMDQRGLVIEANPAAERIFGSPRARLIGMPVSDLLAPEERDAHRARVEGSVPGKAIDAVLLRAGQRFLAELTIVRIENELGPIFTAFVRDVTESRRAAEVLRVQRDEAERTARALLVSEERLRVLTARLHAIREEEGRRIAREVHDTVGQALTGLRMDLSWLERNAPSTVVEVNERRESMFALVDSAIDTVRRIVTQIRPGVLDDLGLEAAISWQASEFQKRTGVPVRVELPPHDLDIPPEHSTVLFRVLQELLTNVARHARASFVAARLAQDGRGTVLEVADDGVGIADADTLRRDAIGILGMRERLLPHGGSLDIAGAPGAGTRARAWIPLPAAERTT